ncbi:MAG: hypothetical protein MK008_00550 [Bdellovibrionales bacterium]|nr:hypothetical protein [Bdellovibrionales bacterium]
MRAKYVSIAISVVAISIVAISYHLQLKELFISQSQDMLKSELSIQAELAADKINYNLANLQKQFIEIGQTEGYERMTKPQGDEKAMSSQLIDSPFLGMALLTPDPTWTPMWVSLNSEIHDKWSKIFLTQVWGQLPYSRLDDVSSFWYKVPNKDSGFSWALIQKVKIPTTELPEKGDDNQAKPAILVGFLPEAILAEMSSSIQDTSNEVYVVDNYNQTLYHSDLNYLGESLPQYKELENASATLQEFTNTEGMAYIGTKRPLANTNLFLYYGVPAPTPLVFSNKTLSLHIFIWALVVLAVVAFFIFFQNQSEKWVTDVKKLFKKWNANKNLQAEAKEFSQLGVLEPDVKQLKHWIQEQHQDLQTENYGLQQELKNLKETSSVQDQNLLQSLKRPIMLSLGSLQVLKQKNKAFAQTEEFLQVEQTLRSLKERVDMSVNSESTSSEFFLSEVLSECIQTQKDLIDRLGVQLEPHISERLSLTDVKSRWMAVLSQILLELYDWVELSTNKKIQINFLVEGDQPALVFKLSGCSLNPVDIQSINESDFSNMNNPTWKLIGQSLMRMNLGFNINMQAEITELKLLIPNHKVANFALAEKLQNVETSVMEASHKAEPSNEPKPPKAPEPESAKTDIYEITEEDIDLDSFKVIPTQTNKQPIKAQQPGEHDSFVSGTEIGQAPLFSDEEMQEIRKQIEEAKKGKS